LILYNSKKEMVAVSPEVVDFLGYESFEELKENISDIADLFINKPGYIYNFRNFSWIDYIILNHLKSPKVIIKTLTNDIETELSITELISFDEQSKLFCVSFKNLTPINFDGVPTTENLPDFEEFNQPDKKESFKNDAIPLESFITEQSDIKNDFENEILSIEPSVSEQPDEDVKISIKEDEPLTINFDEISIDEPLIIEEEIKKPEIVGLTLEEKLYDIKSVAEELGLDESLIRDLLVEFIAQAYELKPQIEEALKNEDFTLVHNLIHKIKGAVANLRVEKANEILSNTSNENDPKILKEILDQLYDFIEKFNSELMLSVSKPQEAVEKEKIEEIVLEEEPEKNIEKIKTEIIYDPSIASEELGISKDIVLEFVKEFIEQSLNLKNVFDSYLKNSDIESIKNLSHKLKGTATNLRIEKADNILSKILKSKDLDKIRDLIDEFNRTIEEIASNLGFAGKTNEPSKEVGSKILNVEEILDHGAHTIGLDIETYKEFIAEYLKEIENLFTLEDIENIKKEAQKLKSIAENLRLDPITEKLETVLESSDNEQITVIISDIKEILKNLKNI